MGRKPIRAEFKRDKRLVVMLTAAEMKILEKAANKAKAESLSAWVRDTLMAAAQ